MDGKSKLFKGVSIMRNRKRGNGEGSIYKRSNNTWTGKIMLGYKSDGKPNRKSVYGKTKKEVQIKLSKLANLNYTGTYIEPSKCLFKDWIINWLNEYKKVKIKPTTYDCYDNIIESIIIPKLGKYKLCDLTNEIIQKFINNMKLGSKNYSSSTIVKTHMIINNSLKQAIVNKMIMNNPASNIELPKRIQKQIRAFTIEEEKRFLESAKGYRLYEAFFV
jgi:integrase